MQEMMKQIRACQQLHKAHPWACNGQTDRWKGTREKKGRKNGGQMLKKMKKQEMESREGIGLF